jgi:hypothetical protein
VLQIAPLLLPLEQQRQTYAKDHQTNPVKGQRFPSLGQDHHEVDDVDYSANKKDYGPDA